LRWLCLGCRSLFSPAMGLFEAATLASATAADTNTTTRLWLSSSLYSVALLLFSVELYFRTLLAPLAGLMPGRFGDGTMCRSKDNLKPPAGRRRSDAAIIFRLAHISGPRRAKFPLVSPTKTKRPRL
jgi:hypothetical protein